MEVRKHFLWANIREPYIRGGFYSGVYNRDFMVSEDAISGFIRMKQMADDYTSHSELGRDHYS